MKHFSATMLGWVLCSQNAFAETVSSEDFTGVDWVEMHGPEKPPPDDGYTFKGAKGGNGLGKLGLAAMGAGIGLGYVGSAGLAVITENPALQSKVFIFIGLVESIAIYGIVMMFIILGQ